MVLKSRWLKKRWQSKWCRCNWLSSFLIFMVSATWNFYICSPQWHVTWSLPNSSYWWNLLVSETFTAHEWLENFHVSQGTFRYLYQQLWPYIECISTQWRDAVLEKCTNIAIMLWTFASPMEFRSVNHLFGICRSTVCEVFNETFKAIVEHLLYQYITFPPV